MAWWRRSKPTPEKNLGSFELRNSSWPLITVDDYAQLTGAGPVKALQSVAVWASVDLIASVCSELPIDVFRGSGRERSEIGMDQHPWLEDPAGDGNGLEDWVYQLVISWLTKGNAYGHVLDRPRPGRGDFITQLAWWAPEDVSVSDISGEAEFLVNGNSVNVGVRPGELVHRRVNPRPGRLLGMSPIEHHMRTTIGLGLAAGEFGSRWFQDGGHPSALLTNSEVELDQDQARLVKSRFLSSLRGTREPVVFGKGWKYEPIQINPDESQFLETKRFTSAESARIFGPGMAEILGYETGGSLTYTSSEMQSVHLLKYTLNKWMRRVERTIGVMLPRGQYAHINRDAMLQSTTLERYKAHASALDKQWRTVNEVRDLEDLAPVAWGETPNAIPGAAPQDDPGQGDPELPADEEGDE